jgi:hypothetical protein
MPSSPYSPPTDDELHIITDFFDTLDIPLCFGGCYISSKVLYDILNDKEKLKIIVSKLHNKVFW